MAREQVGHPGQIGQCCRKPAPQEQQGPIERRARAARSSRRAAILRLAWPISAVSLLRVANQRPDAVRRAALELLGEGLSEREVLKALESQGMQCSRGSLQNWRKTAGAAEPPPAQREARTAAAPTAPLVAPPSQTAAAVVDADLSDEHLLRLPVQELARMMIKIRDRFVREVESPELDHTVLGALMREAERAAKALVLARPPVRLDPEKDPSSLQAREAVLEKMRRLAAKEQSKRSAPTE